MSLSLQHTVMRIRDKKNIENIETSARLRAVVACANDYCGAISSMVAAIEDKNSALHYSCVEMKAAGARLLTRAQAKGSARRDINGADLFSLVGALAWLGDQPSSARRAEHLFDVIANALLTKQTCEFSVVRNRAFRRAFRQKLQFVER